MAVSIGTTDERDVPMFIRLNPKKEETQEEKYETFPSEWENPFPIVVILLKLLTREPRNNIDLKSDMVSS